MGTISTKPSTKKSNRALSLSCRLRTLRMLRNMILVLALLGVAYAGCPNQCSGHGSCNAYDLCTCYNHWGGSDCSERVCPKNKAWFVPSPASGTVANNHADMYCSNRGVCDTKTGTCKCGDGFTGTACMRSECPNDCSGHGICRQLKDYKYIKTDGTVHDGTAAADYYGGGSGAEWDADKIQGCKCDITGGSGHGFEGPDCSLVRCAEADDLLTGIGANSHAWGANQGPASDANHYCSDRGTCDFSTGLCQCYTGFTGVVCDVRTSLI